MKFDYYQGIIKTLVNMMKKNPSPEWKEYSDNLRNLVERLDDYHKLSKEGEYKVMTSKQEYDEIEELFKKSLAGYDKFKDQPIDPNDPLDVIRHRLADDVFNDFLTPAYVEYQHAIQSGTPPEVILQAAHDQFDDIDAEEIQFMTSAERWLRNKGWEQVATGKSKRGQKKAGERRPFVQTQFD